jgi:hypothetical protein
MIDPPRPAEATPAAPHWQSRARMASGSPIGGLVAKKGKPEPPEPLPLAGTDYRAPIQLTFLFF